MFNSMFYTNDFSSLSPLATINNSARNYAIELSQELGTSADMVACGLVALFAATQVGACCSLSTNRSVGLSLYLAIGAPSGASKSTIERRLRKVLEELIAKHIVLTPDKENHILVKRSILEGKKKKIIKKAYSIEDEEMQNEYAKSIVKIDENLKMLTIPVSPLMGNMSIPSFIEELSLRNGHGIRIDSEGGILTELDTVLPTKLTPFLNVWSNDPVEDISKKKQVRIPNPFFVTMTMWQTEPLCKFIRNNAYREIGFVARWLICIENDWTQKVGIGSVSSRSEEWYKNQLERSLCRNIKNFSSGNNVDDFRLSEDACFVVKKFKEFLVIEQGKGKIFANYQDIAIKLDIHAVRIAMVLCAMDLCDDKSEDVINISSVTMYNACRLAMYFATQLVSNISRFALEELKKESLPLIQYFSEIQSRLIVDNGLCTDEICSSLGYTKAKFRRLIRWMSSNNWVVRQDIIMPCLGRPGIMKEAWRLLVNFKDL